MFKLTQEGIKKCEQFIAECEAKRKEILDAGIDTAYDTEIPTATDIELDINFEGLDEEGEYYTSWCVTDHFSSRCISLVLGKHIIELVEVVT